MNATESLDSNRSPTLAGRRTRSGWLRALALMAAIGLVLLVVLAVVTSQLSLPAPVTLRVDGDEWFSSASVTELTAGHQAVLAVVVLVGLLAAAVVLPVALIVGVVSVLALVLVAVLLPLLAVAAVVGLLLSPLLLLGWLVWKLVAA